MGETVTLASSSKVFQTSVFNFADILTLACLLAYISRPQSNPSDAAAALRQKTYSKQDKSENGLVRNRPEVTRSRVLDVRANEVQISKNMGMVKNFGMDFFLYSYSLAISTFAFSIGQKIDVIFFLLFFRLYQTLRKPFPFIQRPLMAHYCSFGFALSPLYTSLHSSTSFFLYSP